VPQIRPRAARRCRSQTVQVFRHVLRFIATPACLQPQQMPRRRNNGRSSALYPLDLTSEFAASVRSSPRFWPCSAVKPGLNRFESPACQVGCTNPRAPQPLGNDHPRNLEVQAIRTNQQHPTSDASTGVMPDQRRRDAQRNITRPATTPTTPISCRECTPAPADNCCAETPKKAGTSPPPTERVSRMKYESEQPNVNSSFTKPASDRDPGNPRECRIHAI